MAPSYPWPVARPNSSLGLQRPPQPAFCGLPKLTWSIPQPTELLPTRDVMSSTHPGLCPCCSLCLRYPSLPLCSSLAFPFQLLVASSWSGQMPRAPRHFTSLPTGTVWGSAASLRAWRPGGQGLCCRAQCLPLAQCLAHGRCPVRVCGGG